ncbi:hypothetical protein HMPREF9412_0865 [Paenibacillus sp. HGF5]|nr:hypothetical protein HMPREF9412_0865 [Paenibacillus sp. HGF5]
MRPMPLMMSDHLFSFSPIYMRGFANVDGNVQLPENRTSCFQRSSDRGIMGHSI